MLTTGNLFERIKNMQPLPARNLNHQVTIFHSWRRRRVMFVDDKRFLFLSSEGSEMYMMSLLSELKKYS